MANVAFSSTSNSFGFHPKPVKDAPGAFGFGFGLSNSTISHGWNTMPFSSQPSTSFASPQVSPLFNQNTSRPQKRRHEDESENDPREDAMDRSPTPERPKRAVPKRARTTIPEVTEKGVNNKGSKLEEDDVDIGVLLASLPQEALLPILTSLIQSQPTLKSSVLPLIPRPTVDSAIHALAVAAKKLRDAYPYSNTHSGPFSFGSSAGQSQQGMRDPYVTTRLAPHITEFVNTWQSYLPYFSCSSDTSQTSSRALQLLHRDQSQPPETYLFLAAATSHFFAQPPLTQTSMALHLLPRLSSEWKAWIAQIDVRVNHQGGMFGSETVRSWIAGLDEFAHGKDSEGVRIMREVRDQWVQSVGWLVGRRVEHPMV